MLNKENAIEYNKRHGITLGVFVSFEEFLLSVLSDDLYKTNEAECNRVMELFSPLIFTFSGIKYDHDNQFPIGKEKTVLYNILETIYHIQIKLNIIFKVDDNEVISQLMIIKYETRKLLEFLIKHDN